MTHSFPTRRSSDLEIAALFPLVVAQHLKLPVTFTPETHAALKLVLAQDPQFIIGAKSGKPFSIGIMEAFNLFRIRSDWTLNRSEEHTSELQSLMRISYAVFCLKKKNNTTNL